MNKILERKVNKALNNSVIQGHGRKIICKYSFDYLCYYLMSLPKKQIDMKTFTCDICYATF